MSKRQPLFRLATMSLKAHKWIYTKLCAVFVCMSVIICLFFAFNMAMENRNNEIFELNVSSNYVYSTDDCSLVMESFGLTDYRHYTVGRYNLSEQMKENIHADVPTVSTNYITLDVGGVKYRLRSKAKSELLWLFKGNPFNDADVAEMQKLYDSETLYIGEFPKDQSREILISEKLLESYGLTADQVIGKQLQIWLGENADRIWDTNLTVSGVIVKEYYELSGHKSNSWQIAPSVVAAENNTIPAINVKVDTIHMYVLDKWTTLPLDEINELVGRGPVYCGIESYNQREFLGNIRTVVSNVFYIVGTILIVGLLLTVMLMIDKFVTVFLRTGGILLGFGLQQKNLRRLLFTHVLLAALLSVPLALVGAAVGYAIIVELVSVGTGVALTVSTVTLVTLLMLSVAVVLIAAAIFFGVAWLRVRKKSVRQMLSATD